MATQAPTRLPSEDVIISAPFSYAGSAQRIWRIRRRATEGAAAVAITVLAVFLISLAWFFVTSWYLVWGFWLVPYRLVRRGERKRKVEALRHRELLGSIQGAAAASAPPPVSSPDELVSDTDREAAIDELRRHMLAGRLTTEEFEQRVAAAQAARTRAHLDAARLNLPVHSGS